MLNFDNMHTFSTGWFKKNHQLVVFGFAGGKKINFSSFGRGFSRVNLDLDMIFRRLCFLLASLGGS